MEHAGFSNGLGTTQKSIVKQIKSVDNASRILILELNNVPVGEMNYRNKGNSVVKIGIKMCEFKEHEKGYGTCFLKMLIKELLDKRGYKKNHSRYKP